MQSSGAHYIGAPVARYTFKKLKLDFMQGGAFAVSRHAAEAVATCSPSSSHGGWQQCPNRYLEDMDDALNSALHVGQTCFDERGQHDDLFAGICVREAGLRSGVEPCFINHPPRAAESAWRRSVVRGSVRGKLKKCPNGCPISEHALKGVSRLQAASALYSGRCRATLRYDARSVHAAGETRAL